MTARSLVPVGLSSAEVSAAIASMPLVVEARREHAIALLKPMVGCPWKGEPRVDVAPDGDGLMPLPAWFDWEVGAYAAALLRKREPAFATVDLSHMRTRFEPPATVLFVTDVRCRRSRRRPEGLKTLVVAEVQLPAHVLGLAVLALPAPTIRPLPREVPRLVTPSRSLQESAMRFTSDNPPSRKRPAARTCGVRS